MSASRLDCRVSPEWPANLSDGEFCEVSLDVFAHNAEEAGACASSLKETLDVLPLTFVTGREAQRPAVHNAKILINNVLRRLQGP